MNSTGLVRGVKPGIGVVRATVAGSDATTRAISVIPPVSAVRWIPKSANLSVGDTLRLVAQALGEGLDVLQSLKPVGIALDGSRAARIVEWDQQRGTLIQGEHQGTLVLVARVGHKSDTAVITIVPQQHPDR